MSTIFLQAVVLGPKAHFISKSPLSTKAILIRAGGALLGVSGSADVDESEEES